MTDGNWTFDQMLFGQDVASSYFGNYISLSNDGNRLVAMGTGYAFESAEVRVFEAVGANWTQLGTNISSNDFNQGYLVQGQAVTMSGNGNRIALGGSQALSFLGLVKVYEYTSDWTQVYSNIQGTNANEGLGGSLAFSDNGLILAVGGSQYGPEYSVKVYDDSGTAWNLRSELWASTYGINTHEGFGVAMDTTGDGSRLVIGAQTANGGTGKVITLDWNGTAWTEGATALLGGADDRLGGVLAMSKDGTVLAIQKSIVPTMTDRSVNVYTYDVGTTQWSQMGTPITSAAHSNSIEIAGHGLDISGDGKYLAVGFNSNFGSVKIYSLPYDSQWNPLLSIEGGYEYQFGNRVTLSYDGSRMVHSAPLGERYDAPPSISDVGDVYAYSNPAIATYSPPTALPVFVESMFQNHMLSGGCAYFFHPYGSKVFSHEFDFGSNSSLTTSLCSGTDASYKQYLVKIESGVISLNDGYLNALFNIWTKTDFEYMTAEVTLNANGVYTFLPFNMTNVPSYIHFFDGYSQLSIGSPGTAKMGVQIPVAGTPGIPYDIQLRLFVRHDIDGTQKRDGQDCIKVTGLSN